MAHEGKKTSENPAARVQGKGLYASVGLNGRIFRKTVLQTLTILTILVMAMLAWQTIHILLLFFSGVLLAVLLEFFGSRITRLATMPYWLAVTIVVIILIGFLGLFIFLMIPAISREFQTLVVQIAESINLLRKWIATSPLGGFIAERFLGDANFDLGAWWGRVAGFFSTSFGAVAGIGIILIVGVFLAYNPGLYVSGFLHLVPLDHRQRASEVITEIGTTLRGWLLAQLISMLVLTVSTWIMLRLMGVPLALLLALLTGLLTFIPYLGPIIALIPILLLAFLQSPFLALYVLLFYLVIQNTEANVLMPIIYHRTASIPPALGVISQILFGSLLGFLGFVLAIPLMAAILQFVKLVYVADVLGDKSVENHPA